MKLLILLLILIFSVAIPLSLAVNVTDAISAIENAEKNIQEMTESNFSVNFVNDTLINAKNDFMRGDYESVIEKTKTIDNRKGKAYEISDSLNSLKIRIEELENMGIDTTDLKNILKQAEREFYYENYDEANKLIDEAFNKISDIEARQTILKIRYESTKNLIISFVKNNKELLITIFMSLIFVTVISFKVFKKIKIKKELENLNLEKNSIEGSIKNTQIKRYKEHNMSKKTYEITMSKYKTRMREIENRILVLQKKLKRK